MVPAACTLAAVRRAPRDRAGRARPCSSAPSSSASSRRSRSAASSSPAHPGRGIGMLVAAGTLGRAATAIPATRLYERFGFGAAAVLGTGFAVVAAARHARCAGALLRGRGASLGSARVRKVVTPSFGSLDQLTVVEEPDLVPAPGQVVIDVEAAGVNFVDGLIVEGRYQVKPPMPYTPGSEVAGTISAVGDGVLDRSRRRAGPGPAVVGRLRLAGRRAVAGGGADPRQPDVGPGRRARAELRHDALRADPPHDRRARASGSPCSAPAAASGWPPSTWPRRSGPRSWRARRRRPSSTWRRRSARRRRSPTRTTASTSSRRSAR